jgi:predicted GIY-YIG superfamily endonuclease
MGQYYVYILLCSDGSYYVGSTQNLSERVKAHVEGRGCRYTAQRRPVRLVYSESQESESAAVRRELQIKRWSRAKKEALIGGDRERLRQLSQSRDQPSRRGV